MSYARTLRTLMIVLLVGLLVWPGSGRAQLIVLDPANLVQNILQAVRALIQIEKLIEQIEIMLQNTTPQSALWPDFASAVHGLAQVIEQEEALAYALRNLDGVFRQKFPGYTPPHDFQAEYALWTETVLDTLRGSLNAVQEQDRQFASEQQRILALAALSESAVGRLAAIQAGNAIMAEQTTHLAKLRQLIMTQIDSQNTYMAQELNQQAQIDALTTAWLTGGELVFPAQVQGEGFRRVPSR